MKRLLLLLILSCFVSCSTSPVKEPKVSGMMKNACLPEAIIMTGALREHQIEAKVLAIFAQDMGHAICVYMYPPGKNQLWGWDSHWKSLRLRAYINDPELVAKAWLRSTNPQKTLKSANYIE